ncbi:MAG: MDR family MFS transporter [Chloroflexota bacterium]
MFSKLQALFRLYPRQFWLMITGIFISTAGGSMIWPFILIFVGNKLDLPLSTTATLVTINAGTGLFSSLLAGSLADKTGRKIIMVSSMALTGAAYFFMLRANSYPAFAALMFLIGLSNPLYQVGADAMLADLIPEGQRMDAYAINRVALNAGFAFGPAVGGFVAAQSYDLAFYAAATGMLLHGLLLLLLARETLDKSLPKTNPQGAPGGYTRVLKDRSYLAFVLASALGLAAPIMLWILLPVYVKSNFGIPESQYGWLPTTNALMCVFVQYFVTLVTRRYRTLPVVAFGMLVYALSVGGVALASSFWGFWICMVFLTFGELIIVPTSSTYVANRAPADLRGRYMSVYWLGWGLARALAPIIGGFLNDAISPTAIWYGGMTIGLVSTSSLGLMAWMQKLRANLAP